MDRMRLAASSWASLFWISSRAVVLERRPSSPWSELLTGARFVLASRAGEREHLVAGGPHLRDRAEKYCC